MFRFLFPASLDRVHQYAGNLFYRKVPPSEIKAMNFCELKYWNSWHEILDKTEAKQVEDIIDA